MFIHWAILPADPKTLVVYCVQVRGAGAIKIGVSRMCSLKRRLDQIQTGCPHYLALCGVVPGGRYQEQKIHDALVGSRIRPNGEWFDPTPQAKAFFPKIRLVEDTSSAEVAWARLGEKHGFRHWAEVLEEEAERQELAANRRDGMPFFGRGQRVGSR